MILGNCLPDFSNNACTSLLIFQSLGSCCLLHMKNMILNYLVLEKNS